MTFPGNEGFDISHYHHVDCFSLPRKYTKGADKISAEDFVKDVLQDESGEILPAMADEIAQKIEEKAPSSAKKAAQAGGEDEDPGDPMNAIKELYKQRQEEEDSGKEPAKKKAKGDMTLKVDAYEFYKGMKGDDLRDILGWNHQVKAGNKEFVLFKCVDGHVYGRLTPCPACTGKLKMHDSMTKITCLGQETDGGRIPCNNSYSIEEAPRWSPW